MRELRVEETESVHGAMARIGGPVVLSPRSPLPVHSDSEQARAPVIEPTPFPLPAIAEV